VLLSAQTLARVPLGRIADAKDVVASVLFFASPGRRAALWSQVPMLVLMVAYTMSSLWMLSQPITG
jgi:hypothetical protein